MRGLQCRAFRPVLLLQVPRVTCVPYVGCEPFFPRLLCFLLYCAVWPVCGVSFFYPMLRLCATCVPRAPYVLCVPFVLCVPCALCVPRLCALVCCVCLCTVCVVSAVRAVCEVCALCVLCLTCAACCLCGLCAVYGSLTCLLCVARVPCVLCVGCVPFSPCGLFFSYFFKPVLRRPTPHSMFDLTLHCPTPC